MTKPIAPDTLERSPGLRRVVHELRLSQGVFRDYGYQHQDKADAATTTKDRLERERKAKRNLDRAAACQEALNAFDEAGGIEALEANNRQLQLCREALEYCDAFFTDGSPPQIIPRVREKIGKALKAR